jgi:hypothetical protein
VRKNRYGTAFVTRINSEISRSIYENLLFSLETFRYRVCESGLNSPLQNFREGYEKAVEELNRQKETTNNQVELERRFYGFPLNVPFTSLEAVWQAVDLTEICEFLDNEVEYVLAVRTFKHPAYLVSVWVFVGVI